MPPLVIHSQILTIIILSSAQNKRDIACHIIENDHYPVVYLHILRHVCLFIDIAVIKYTSVNTSLMMNNAAKCQRSQSLYHPSLYKYCLRAFSFGQR
jgi:hypothetical protein